ncbi:MAG: ABC transporter ATP-binding protein [Candidatus Bipolaricaulota bacterium]
MSEPSRRQPSPSLMRPARGHGMRFEHPKNARGSLVRLLAYLKPYRVTLGLVVLVATLATAMDLLGPYLMGRAVNEIVARSGLAAILEVVGWMVAAFVVAWLGHTGQGVVMATVAQRAMRVLRRDLFAHLETLSLRFYDGRSAGELMSRLTNDMDAISRVLSQNVTMLFTGMLTLVGILIVMFLLNVWLALASMIVLPLMIGLVGAVGRKTRGAFREYQKNLGTLNGTLEEAYSGQRVVMAFGQQGRVLDAFDGANEAVRRVGATAMTYSLLLMPMMGILSNANVAVIVGLGGYLTLKGLASIGLIATFITYSRRFAEPLRQLGDLYNQVQAALAGAERVFEALDTVPDLRDAPDAIDLPRVEGHVEFDDVSFSYVKGEPVLRHVTLSARPGERVALVGPTGAGKTTLVNVLTRFYDLESGAIRIDGVDIRTVTRDSLRRQLGIVLQQTFLFAESVKENIRYGRLDATDEEVVAAARLANADGFIRRLPHGYDTLLSERGANLSEGQRQLLAIARAILADPRILVLDEATSSVDTRTEVHIQEALLELMKGRTSFVIAHRLSTIRGADQILMIDGGEVVEHGTHDELMSSRGSYYRLYMSQFRGRVEVSP